MEMVHAHREEIEKIRSALTHYKESPAHAQRIIPMLNGWLMDDEQRAALDGDARNWFYLHAAAYLKHQEDIVKNRTRLGIPEREHAQAVAEIVQSANRPAEQWHPAPSGQAAGRRAMFRMDLLAGALALAERLDLHHPETRERIRQWVNRSTGSVNSVNKEVGKIFSVEHIGPHPHQPATILVQIHCRDAGLHRGLKHYETEAERFLGLLNKVVRPRFLFNKIRFEIRADGYDPMDFKFAVDGSAALQLFMGNTLYGDKRVFLRELVQNAVDACRLRSLWEPGYTPAIDVCLNAAEDILSVTDNGIGMDRRWMEKYFLNVGISFYRSGEAGDFSDASGPQVSFISNFGIGFLSTFLVARRIRVRTRKPGAPGLAMTLTDIGDYFDVRRADDETPVGTEVTVELKSSPVKHWRGMEYLGYLKSIARFVSIPVAFADSQGNTTLIGGESLNLFADSASGQNFSADLDIPPSRGALLIRTRGREERIFDLDSAAGGISIFQNGVFIAQTDDLLPPKARKYVVGRINLTGEHVCELSMDRNRIFWSQEQLRILRKVVLRGMADAAGQLMTVIEQHNLIPETGRKITQKIAGFFEPAQLDDALFEALHPNVRQLLRRHFRSLIRTGISRTDLPGRDLSAIAAAHGFRYRWQQTVIADMAQ